MGSKKIVLCFVFGLLSMVVVKGQTAFEVPRNVEFKTKEDYAKYENAIIHAAKWLEDTDLDKEMDKRKQINAFVVQWLSGSPTVSVEINEKLGSMCEKNPHLLAIYLASYAKHYLENKTTATKLSATKAGLLSIMKVYKKKIDIKKSKEMDKLIKSSDENKLDEYISANFK